jgi:hypothetical protein
MKGTTGTKRNPPPGQEHVGQTMEGTFSCRITAPGHVKCDFHEPRYAGTQRNPPSEGPYCTHIEHSGNIWGVCCPATFPEGPYGWGDASCMYWLAVPGPVGHGARPPAALAKATRLQLPPATIAQLLRAYPSRGCKGCIPACNWPKEYCKCGTCKPCPGKDCGKYDRSATEVHARSLQAQPAPAVRRMLRARNPVFMTVSPPAPVLPMPPNEVARVRAFSSGGGPMGAYYRCMQHQYDMGVRGPARAQACAPMLPR